MCPCIMWSFKNYESQTSILAILYAFPMRSLQDGEVSWQKEGGTSTIIIGDLEVLGQWEGANAADTIDRPQWELMSMASGLHRDHRRTGSQFPRKAFIRAFMYK